jgi:transaldolase
MASLWLNCYSNNELTLDLKNLLDSDKICGVYVDVSRFEGSRDSGFYGVDIEALKSACDLLIDKYDDGEDGFVACSINPNYAYDKSKIIKEAKELYAQVDKENFMVAIATTKEGIEAMHELSSNTGGVSNIYASHIYSPNQAAQSVEVLSHYEGNIETVLGVCVASFDRELNVPLATNNLSKDRVGFFNAIKIYNQIALTKVANVNYKVAFCDLNVEQNWLEKNYYVEQLNLENGSLVLNRDLIDILDDDLDDSFEFQTKHIDAFLGYLAYANVSLQATYEKLLKSALDDDINSFNKSV